MATFDNRDAIDSIIARNGDREAGDPPGSEIVKVVEYTNVEGRQCWGVVFRSEGGWGLDRYEVETEFVRAPKVIWRRELK